MLGHGGSSHPDSGYGPQDTARLAARLVERLDLHDVIALGHSMGCEHAVALAEASPRVAALVMLSEGPDMTTALIPAGESLMRTPALGPLLVATTPGWAVRLGYRSFVGSLRDRAAYVDKIPLDDRLRDLALPTLIVFGDKDRLHDVEQSVARYRTVPNTRVEVLSGVGHMTPAEKPDAVADLVTAFLQART